MIETIEMLEKLLMEMKLKYHFENKNEYVKIKREDLCQFLLDYMKLLKYEELEKDEK